jgi:hypothetical protein
MILVVNWTYFELKLSVMRLDLQLSILPTLFCQWEQASIPLLRVIMDESIVGEKISLGDAVEISCRTRKPKEKKGSVSVQNSNC